MYCMGWWRTLCLEGNLEMADYLIDCLEIFDEGNDLHLTSTRRIEVKLSTRILISKSRKTLVSMKIDK